MEKCLQASHKTKYTPSQQFYFTKLAKINKNEFTKLLAQEGSLKVWFIIAKSWKHVKSSVNRKNDWIYYSLKCNVTLQDEHRMYYWSLEQLEWFRIFYHVKANWHKQNILFDSVYIMRYVIQLQCYIYMNSRIDITNTKAKMIKRVVILWEWCGNWLGTTWQGILKGVGMLYTSLKVGFPHMYAFFKSERM